MLNEYVNITERHKNMLNILRCIMRTGMVSTNDITEATGLSFATISRVLAALQKLKLIIKCGKSYTDMGRHPEIFAVNNKYAYLVHFFINTDSVSAWIADFGNHVIAKTTHKITMDITANELALALEELVNVLTNKLKIDKKCVIAVGIAVPGLVDDKNHVVRRIPNLRCLNNLNLGQCVIDVLKIPVILSNEARLCALGEKICQFPYMDNIVYIDITKYSGIGAGILLNGKILDGNSGVAGEMGDIVINTENLDYEFMEQEGCLETFAGLSKLYKKCEVLLSQNKAPVLAELMLKNRKIDFEMIERAVVMGDAEVIKVYDNVIRMWSIAIINILSIIDPELIILGGVLDDKNSVTLSRIKSYVKNAVYHEVKIQLTAMGEEAQLFGGLNTLSSYAFEQIVTKKIVNS